MTWRRWYERKGRGLPTWPVQAPHRISYLSTETGAWSPVLHDLRTGERRLVRAEAGAARGVMNADGSGLVWFRDDGSEHGEFVITRFDGATVPFAPELGSGRRTGLASGGGIVAASLDDTRGFALAVGDRVLLRQDTPLAVHGVAGDGSFISLRPATAETRLVDAATGAVQVVPGRAEHWDSAPGSARLLIRGADGWKLRDLAAGSAAAVPLAARRVVADWYGDDLLVAFRDGPRTRLARADLATGAEEEIDTPPGTVYEARLRPDGRVWMSFGSGSLPRHLRSSAPRDTELAAIAPAPPEPGAPLREISYDNGEGEAVGALLAMPIDRGPHPAVVLLHGGPHAEARDAWDPAVQAWIDMGFAVLLPNFRGSTGREDAWRAAIVGDPGRLELIDIAAGVQHLVRDGIADPSRIVVSGASWGGYLALMCAGRLPRMWAAVIADRPLADPALAYESGSPEMRAFDRSLFGGSPEDEPALWRERSPRASAHLVAAPILITAAERDARCPLNQIEAYVADLARHGVPYEFAVDGGGHTTRTVDGAALLQERALAFALDHTQKETP